MAADFKEDARPDGVGEVGDQKPSPVRPEHGRVVEVQRIAQPEVEPRLSAPALREIRRACDGDGLTITCVSSPIGKERADGPTAAVVHAVEHACRSSADGHQQGEHVLVFPFKQKLHGRGVLDAEAFIGSAAVIRQ